MKDELDIEADRIIRATCRDLLNRNEILERFVRKVARITFIDVEIACGGPAYIGPDSYEIRHQVKNKLKKLIRKAKVLTGKVKEKHTTLTPAGASKTPPDSSP